MRSGREDEATYIAPFRITDRVGIPALKGDGVVESVWFTMTGVQYEVAYWHEGKRYKEYLYEWELKPHATA